MFVLLSSFSFTTRLTIVTLRYSTVSNVCVIIMYCSYVLYCNSGASAREARQRSTMSKNQRLLRATSWYKLMAPLMSPAIWHSLPS